MTEPAAADPVSGLQRVVGDAAAELKGSAVELAPLERPPKPDFGDYSTNAAMVLAPALGNSPRAVAEKLGAAVSDRMGDALERVEIAGPGFLNLFVSEAWLRGALAQMVAAAGSFGSGVAASRERILLEFVSANPTGPITVASARHAAYGDSLARILELAGHAVEREYYVNDYGGQVRLFAESIQARARGEEPPEGGYRGDYVSDLAARIDDAAEADLERLAREATAAVLAEVRDSLERFGVGYDRFFSERSLHEEDAIAAAIALLERGDSLYTSGEALWLRTTAAGDDKDRVVVRGNGEVTYFGADIAYHLDKLRRGYDRALNVLGADHHGYVARVRAAWQALGGDPDAIEFVVMQLVNLTEAGERVQMSKRGGEFVTLDELVEDIGVDAARFFLLQRSHDTTIDLDLTLARRQSQDNPVYYVQYAHARIASILRRAGQDRVETALAADLAGSHERLHPSARTLVERLLSFPTEIAIAAERRAPHRLTTFAHDAAQDFSAFYRDCKVLGADQEGGDERFRLALCEQTRRLLQRSLALLGVSAPEEM